MGIELAREFEQFKALHKYCVLKAKLMKDYIDLENQGIDIPYFLKQETPEQKADKEIAKMLMFNKEKFNSLYEDAWNNIAEKMP